MKYFLIFIVLISIFLFIRLIDKENPLIGETIEEPLLDRMASYRPDKRPLGLPANAVWRGEADGGNYIVLPTAIEGEREIYYAEIYHEADGDLIYKGRFRHLHSQRTTCEPINPVEREDIFWDGDILFVENTGQYLLPIDPNTLDIDPYYQNELQNVDKKRYCNDS